MLKVYESEALMCKNECKARLQKLSKQSKKAIPAQKVHWLAVFVSKRTSCFRIPAMYGSLRLFSDISEGVLVWKP